MTRCAVMVLVVVAGLCIATAGEVMAAQETLIYNGDLKAAPAPITLGSWGSGTLQEVTEVQSRGPKSLKLTSQGDFQGGRLDFTTSLDISGYAGQPNAYIEMWVRPYYERPKPAPAAGTPGPAPMPGGVSGQRAGGFAVGPGGSRATGTYGQPGAPTTPSGAYRPPTMPTPYPSATSGRVSAPRAGASGVVSRSGQLFGTVAPRASRTSSRTRSQTYIAPTARRGLAVGRRGVYAQQGLRRRGAYRRQPRKAPKPEAPAQTKPAPIGEAQFRTDAFRVQLVTDKGTAVLSAYPIYPGDRDSSGWVRVGFPLREFKGPIGDKLSRIVVFDERPDIVYIGAMKLLLDTTPLEAKPTAYPAIAKLGQPVTFVLNAKAGLAPVQAVWDFNKEDGVQEETTGARVMNIYNWPGDYEATVTVADATGANAEKKTYTVLVRVR